MVLPSPLHVARRWSHPVVRRRRLLLWPAWIRRRIASTPPSIGRELAELIALVRWRRTLLRVRILSKAMNRLLLLLLVLRRRLL